MINEVNPPRNDYTAAGGTVFAYTFRVDVKTELEVIVTDTNGVEVVKVVDTDYTVSGLGASGGGNVTFGVAPTSGFKVSILPKQPVAQGSDYLLNEGFPSERVETDLDKVVKICRMLWERSRRALSLPKSSTTTDPIVTLDVNGNPVVFSSVSVLDIVTADTAVGNTTSETTIYSNSIAGLVLGTKNKIRVTLFVKAKQHTASQGNLTFRFKYGASTLVVTQVASIPNLTSYQPGVLCFEIVADGATNAQNARLISFNDAFGFNMSGSNGNQTVTSSTEDSTTAKTLSVTAQWSAAIGANQSLVMEHAMLEKLSL